MFDFRIIDMPDGSQVIEPSFKTPFNSLTPSQMEDYIEMDKQLAYMERMKKRERKEEVMKHRLLHKIACFCGIV